MKIIVIFVIIILCILLILFFRTHSKIKKIVNSGPRNFNDVVELMKFIRMVYECEIEDEAVIFGFVKDTYFNNNDSSGVVDGPFLEVSVALITRKGHQVVNTICTSPLAELKKGDFVAVIPHYNARHNIWHYTTIAKLRTHYLGKGKGFQIESNFMS